MKLKEKIQRKAKYYRVGFRQKDPEERLNIAAGVGVIVFFLWWAGNLVF